MPPTHSSISRARIAATTLCLSVLATVAFIPGAPTSAHADDHASHVDGAEKVSQPGHAGHRSVPARARAAETRSFSKAPISGPGLADSVGVNIHLHYDDTAYSRYDDIVKPRLLELGVKHVRDAAYTYPGVSGDSTYYQRVRDLGSHGIGFNLTTSMKTSWSGRTDFSLLDDIEQWSGGHVESFEGVNEPDLQNVSDWVAQSRSVQADLSKTVKSDPDLAGVDVLAPSLTTEEAAVALGDVSAWADYGNLHNYMADRHPEHPGWGTNDYGSLGWNLQRMSSRGAPGKPVITTETGYYASPTTNNGVSESTAGTYMPRMLMNHFTGGISRTYVYEFLRQRNDASDPEANFGMVRPDGSRTPAFMATKTLIDLVGVTGPGRTAGPAQWSTAGDIDGVRQVPIALANGDFLLASWTPTSVWDPEANRALPAPERSVAVASGTDLKVTGVVDQQAGGAFVERRLDTDVARISVGPQMTFLRMSPSKGSGGETPTVPGGPGSPGPGAGGGGGSVGPDPVSKTRNRDRVGDAVARGGRGRVAKAERGVDLRAVGVFSDTRSLSFRTRFAGPYRPRAGEALTVTMRSYGTGTPVRWTSKQPSKVLVGHKAKGHLAWSACRGAAAVRGTGLLRMRVPVGCLSSVRGNAVRMDSLLTRGPRTWRDSVRVSLPVR